ncbi:hypothetical protein FRC04_009290 [Tulasnella sp. 424]|nr:hypothetical protein FRC04_009290 [Tulasnella sp. 424]KAG8973108.1 hypothetical protein FRC05_009118 [Tulasnella sp. 425]
MSFYVKYGNGYYGAFGSLIDNIAQEALNTPLKALKGISDIPPRDQYHITLFSPKELKQVRKDGRFNHKTIAAELDQSASQVTPLGIGGLVHPHAPVLFVVVLWNAGQETRRTFGLPPKQFHITLTPHDNHDIDKGIDSLLHGAFPSDPSEQVLDHVTYSLSVEGKLDRAYGFTLDWCARYPLSPKGFIRLGAIALKYERWKLAMLAYGRGLSLGFEDGRMKENCMRGMLRTADHTEWGSFMLEGEEEQIPSELLGSLVEPWSPPAREVLSDIWKDTKPHLCIESRERFRLPQLGSSEALVRFEEMPRFFRWIVPFHFALMSTPRNASDIQLLASPSIGIRHIITLTEETPLPQEWFDGTGVTHTFIPVKNYHPPSIEQMDIIMRLFEDTSNLPILVHCGGGKGRAGTVAACYIAAFGFGRSPSVSGSPSERDEPVMSASAAISAIRDVRPGSIETERQEDFVRQWTSAVWKRGSILAPLVPEPPPSTPDIIGKINSTADLVVLVGLPGAGKSTFSASLMARSDLWRRISQDDSGPGGRSACEADIGRRGTGKVILDRCNPTADDRKYWVSLASNWSKCPAAVVFDFPANLCISRAQQRPNHPTLPPGNRVRMAVQAMEKAFEMPTLAEGFKGIAIVRSFEAAADALRRISPAGLFKFPRTPHLIDLGAATEDDLVQVPTEPAPTLGQALLFGLQNHAVITEKVDGANLGISLSHERSLLVQNRSHYVNSATHEQFKKLDFWLEGHREELYAILDNDLTFPERYILFGEWVTATHSIPYTRLPGRFIAFDLYDRRTRSFETYDELKSQLIKKAPSIPLVPLIWEGPESTMPDDSRLKEMVQAPSLYYVGPVEGVYLKIESKREKRVVRRGKVVRGDFIAGNDHWTKGIIRWNGILEQEYDVETPR